MLKREIEAAKRQIKTETIQMSLGEISSMYEAGELDILPEFQRLFRWSLKKKTDFVESIFVGIPVPPAFVYENEDGTWELIDGLQRVSTILEFMGVLKDVDTGRFRRSKLTSAKYLKSLDNVVWKDVGSDDEDPLDKSLQLFFRRARLDLQVLKYPSDPDTKYDLFQRLNRGGAYANEQEVRSCSIVMADPEFMGRIRNLAAMDEFQTIFRITEDQRLRQYDVELAVRTIVHSYVEYDGKSDVQEFLDTAILDVIKSFDHQEVFDCIAWVIQSLHQIFGDDALIPPVGSSLKRRFSFRALEAIVAGIAANYQEIRSLKESDEFIRNRVLEFWKQDETIEMSSSGLRGTIRLGRTVPFGEEWFAPHGSS